MKRFSRRSRFTGGGDEHRSRRRRRSRDDSHGSKQAPGQFGEPPGGVPGDTLYRGLLEKIPAVTYMAEVGPQGRWQFVSPQIEAMLGYPAAKWESKPQLWIKSVHPEDRERVLAAEARAHETGEPLAIEYRMVTRQGHVVWVRDEAVVKAGTPSMLEGWLIDITDRKQAEETLQQEAIHDPLTGLLNRRRFDSELESFVQASAQGSEQGALVLLDLDNFKSINDTSGHDAGDSVLRSVARELETTVRKSDSIARLGGDEFAVLLKEVSAREAWSVGAALVKGVRSGLSRDGVTVSVGVAILDGRYGDDAERARLAADRALYHAKALGRDNVCVDHDEPLAGGSATGA